MQNFLPQTRNATRAIIVREEHILLLSKLKGRQSYALPGGAQDVGETLHQALQRECLEEIGTEVEVHRLLHVADYFKLKATSDDVFRHQIEFLFYCSVAEEYQPIMGPHPDKGQNAVVWMAIKDLPDINLSPRYYARLLADPLLQNDPLYLGLIQ